MDGLFARFVKSSLEELGNLEPLLHRLLRDTGRGLQVLNRQIRTSFGIGAVAGDNERSIVRPQEARPARVAESKRRDADIVRQVVRLVAKLLREQRTETRIVHTLLPRPMSGQHQPSRSVMIPFRRREAANDREVFHLLGHPRQMLTDLNARHGRLNRLRRPAVRVPDFQIERCPFESAHQSSRAE